MLCAGMVEEATGQFQGSLSSRKLWSHAQFLDINKGINYRDSVQGVDNLFCVIFMSEEKSGILHQPASISFSILAAQLTTYFVAHLNYQKVSEENQQLKSH